MENKVIMALQDYDNMNGTITRLMAHNAKLKEELEEAKKMLDDTIKALEQNLIDTKIHVYRGVSDVAKMLGEKVQVGRRDNHTTFPFIAKTTYGNITFFQIGNTEEEAMR